MPNKYYFDVPYSCSTYGRVKGYVIAYDEEEAQNKIYDRDFEDEEYNENGSEDYNYEVSEGEITVEEYDIYDDGEYSDDDEYNDGENDEKEEVPAYYLADVLFI